MTPTPELETKRLLMRPLQLGDAEQVQPLFAQWDVVKFLNDRVPWPYPPDGVFRFYSDVSLPAMERGGAWSWTLRLKTSPEEILGAIDLKAGERLNRGFWMGVPWQGRGLMTEAVIAANDFWFGVLGFPVLRVQKAVANATSQRISEKTGMRVIAVEEHDYVSGKLLTEIWELTADEWWAWRRLQGLGD